MSVEDPKDAEIADLKRQLAESKAENDRTKLALIRSQSNLQGTIQRLNGAVYWLGKERDVSEQARRTRDLELLSSRGYRETLRRLKPEERKWFQEHLAVDIFLAGVGLTTERLGRMPQHQRERVVPLLRRYAAHAYAEPNGWSSNNQIFFAAIHLLNIYDPRLDRNQLIPPKKNP